MTHRDGDRADGHRDVPSGGDADEQNDYRVSQTKCPL